jgi:hypothetical protein
VISALLLLALNSPPANVAADDIVRAFERQSTAGNFDAMLGAGVLGFLEFRAELDGSPVFEATADVVRQRAKGCVALAPDRDLPLQTAAGEIVARVRFTCAAGSNVDPCEGNLTSIALVRSEGTYIGYLITELGADATVCPERFRQIERRPNDPSLKTGEVSIDSFLEDLQRGRSLEAANRIAKVESLSGLTPQFVDGPTYVAKVQACEASQSDKMPIGYRIAWKCPDGDFLQMISSQAPAPKLLVTEMMRKGYVPKVAPPTMPATKVVQ